MSGTKSCPDKGKAPERSILKDEAGGVLIMFVVMLNAFVILVALSLDMGRGYMTKTAMSGAADAAALAAAKLGPDAKKQERDDEAQKYFEANLPPGETLFKIKYEFDRNVDVRVNSGKEILTVNPSDFSIPTYFRFGAKPLDKLEVASRSAVRIPEDGQPVDFYLVVDASGSMVDNEDATSPVTGLEVKRRQALIESADIMMRYIETLTNYEKLYQVGYTTWNTYLRHVQPLTNDIAFYSLHQFDAMTETQNHTNGASGLRAAYNQLPSGREKAIQSVIFLTDGSFNTMMAPSLDPSEVVTGDNGKACNPSADYPDDYPNIGALPCPNQFGPTDAFAQAAHQCNLLKARENVRLSTIAFGKDVVKDPRNAVFMEYCASTPGDYYVAPGGEELAQIFKKIVRDGIKMKLVE